MAQSTHDDDTQSVHSDASNERYEARYEETTRRVVDSFAEMLVDALAQLVAKSTLAELTKTQIPVFHKLEERCEVLRDWSLELWETRVECLLATLRRRLPVNGRVLPTGKTRRQRDVTDVIIAAECAAAAKKQQEEKDMDDAWLESFTGQLDKLAEKTLIPEPKDKEVVDVDYEEKDRGYDN
jgi:hypothetical protein